jgi:hypothetical protein
LESPDDRSSRVLVTAPATANPDLENPADPMTAAD